jgi:hypothetical protein
MGLPVGASGPGSGLEPDQVEAMGVPDPAVLRDYYAAVRASTTEYVESLSPADLDRVLPEPYDPPPTVGVRLVSLIDHASLHAGQLDYVLGLAGAPTSGP